MTFAAINPFIEDTCVLAVLAYLLARSRVGRHLMSEHMDWRGRVLLGALLGLLGTSEVVFPGARNPYVLHTLLVTFAMWRGGFLVGATVAVVVLVGFATRDSIGSLLLLSVALGWCLCVGEVGYRIAPRLRSASLGLLCGVVAQSGVVVVYRFWLIPGVVFPSGFATVSGIFANAFGMFLFDWILRDARSRDDAERYRLEAERAHALAYEAQLAALRARIHPHFLFNALTSTAALCRLSAVNAEKALLNLSGILRRSLEMPSDAPVLLSEEIEYIRAYVDIEKLRMGNRLTVLWNIEAEPTKVTLPAFALQTLVENAILHGVSAGMEGGNVEIIVQPRKRYTLFAVRDNGVGMNLASQRYLIEDDKRPEHGLQIVAQQLILQYGRRNRLRVFSVPLRGTLVAFTVPTVYPFALPSSETSGQRLIP